jgi:hypothetical protein
VSAAIRHRGHIVAAAAVLVALVGSVARAASNNATLTVYAVPATVQFMNHADDRLRGMSTNPFNVTEAKVIDVTNGKEKGNGPFPGDDVLYTFHLYASPIRGQEIGSAIFTCYYNFIKHAICDAYFDLGRDTLLASGSVAFDNPRFTLSVSGGTRAYLGALGQVDATASAKATQRFSIRLVDGRK